MKQHFANSESRTSGERLPFLACGQITSKSSAEFLQRYHPGRSERHFHWVVFILTPCFSSRGRRGQSKAAELQSGTLVASVIAERFWYGRFWYFHVFCTFRSTLSHFLPLEFSRHFFDLDDVIRLEHSQRPYRAGKVRFTHICA